jgi:predicted KAP-like P-loop ATPase
MLVPGPIQNWKSYAVPKNKHSDQSATLTAPERSILSEEEDQLNRGPFVRRLSDALINPDTKTSTGVVIGVTGQWGSGKSSVLNHLFEIIEHRYPNALMVRFDPWLVSGRDDLIAQFFSEFLGTINESPKLRVKLKDVACKISAYAETVVPFVELVAPGPWTNTNGHRV